MLWLFLGGAPTSICYFFRPSVAHHISGTVHHLIIFIFWAVRGVKGQKIAQNEKQQLHPPRATSREHYSL